MIVVRIEVLPHGHADRAEAVAELEVVNDATGTLTHGNYDVTLALAERPLAVKARVTGFSRALGAVALVRDALQAALTTLHAEQNREDATAILAAAGAPHPHSSI